MGALGYFRAAFDLKQVAIIRKNLEADTTRVIASTSGNAQTGAQGLVDCFASTPEQPEQSMQLLSTRSGTTVAIVVLQNGQSHIDVIMFEFPKIADEASLYVLAAMAPALETGWSMRQPGFVSTLVLNQSRRHKAAPRETDTMDILGEDNAFDLSRSELRVCRLLATGLKAQMIAQELGVSIATVRTHLSSIYAKTNLPGQLEVISHIARFTSANNQAA